MEALAQRGVPQDCIATSIGLKSEKTLRKWYKTELARGASYCRSSLLEMAHARAKKSDSVLIFLLKTQCGLRENVPVSGTGGSGPVDVVYRDTKRGERIAKTKTPAEYDDE